MKARVFLTLVISLFLLAVLVGQAQGPEPQAILGTSFTYQGQLKSGGVPVQGTCDFQFSLWTALTGGSQVGATQTKTAVAVAKGLFTTPIDFGVGAFQGDARYLAIKVRCPAGSGSYITLSPRQLLTAAPYALALPGLWTQPNATSPNIIGGWTGNSVTAGVFGAVIGGGGATDFPAAESALDRGNRVTDIYGTVGGGLGNQAGDDAAPTDIAGYSTVGGGAGNKATAEGATVAGGWFNTASGSVSTVGGGEFNVAAGVESTIGGGRYNVISDTARSATIAGGDSNSASGASAFIGGGKENVVTSTRAFIGSGYLNRAVGSDATIGGGYKNVVTGTYAFIGGGTRNAISGGYSAISGGTKGVVTGTYAFIGGGARNEVRVDSSAVCGGDANIVTGSGNDYSDFIGAGVFNEVRGGSSSIVGGTANIVTGTYAFIGGGGENVAIGTYPVIGGGYQNVVTGTNAFIGAGAANAVRGAYSAISAGYENVVTGTYAFIGAGRENEASGDFSTVGGGIDNVVTGLSAFIGGGGQNAASGEDSVICGGIHNIVTGDYAVIGGGGDNRASGFEAIIPGGVLNVALGDHSFAAGSYAKANSDGCFVWGDSTYADVTCDVVDRWVARASGGVYFYTNGGLTTGVKVSAGGGAWSSVSDRKMKENFAPVDGQDVLRKLANIPIDTWNYKSQDAAIRHIGPVAQDFYAAFGVGEDNVTISTIDADGVALAGLQGAYQMLQEKDARIQAQQTEIDDLKTRVAALEALVAQLAQK